MYLIWNQLLPAHFGLAVIMTKLIFVGEHCFGGGESGVKATRSAPWVVFSLESHIVLMRFLSSLASCLTRCFLLQVTVLHVGSGWRWLRISILIDFMLRLKSLFASFLWSLGIFFSLCSANEISGFLVQKTCLMVMHVLALLKSLHKVTSHSRLP